MKGQGGSGNPESLAERSGGETLGPGADQQAEGVQPRLVGERGERGQRRLSFHISKYIEYTKETQPELPGQAASVAVRDAGKVLPCRLLHFAPLRTAPGSMYAIFESGGKQHRAEPGQRVALEQLEAADGDTVSFDRVLLVRDAERGEVRVGDPYLAGATVSATVLSHYRDRKITVFKRKRRKGYRRKQGHRQARTQIRVEAIHQSEGTT